MATRSNVRITDDAFKDEFHTEGKALGVDNTDDYPEEFKTDDTTPVGTEGYASRAGLTDDELDDYASDDVQDERIRNMITLPQGDWTKQSRWEINKFVFEQDQLEGDVNPAGRTIYTLRGKPESRLVKGVEYMPTLSFRVSPDFRPHKTKANEPDMATKLMSHAKTLFLSLNGRKPKGSKEVLIMLRDAEYTVGTYAGDDGLGVRSLKKIYKK